MHHIGLSSVALWHVVPGWGWLQTRVQLHCGAKTTHLIKSMRCSTLDYKMSFVLDVFAQL